MRRQRSNLLPSLLAIMGLAVLASPSIAADRIVSAGATSTIYDQVNEELIDRLRQYVVEHRQEIARSKRESRRQGQITAEQKERLFQALESISN